MNMDQVVANEQIKYRDEIAQVKILLESLGLSPDTEVRVYPLETGWYATVLVGEIVFIFTWYYDRILTDLQPFSGFYPNGGLIHKKD